MPQLLQAKVEDKIDGQDSIALSPAANDTKHTFHRPPIDGVDSTGNQSGNLPQWTRKIRSLLDLVDFNAFHNPDLLFGLQESKTSAELRSITYKELAEAVGRCIGWLVDQNLNHISSKSHGQESQAKPPPVALLMNSDVIIFIYVLALMRLGIPVALFSARLSPSAIAHLIEKIEVKSMIITSHTARSAKAATDVVQKKGHGVVTCINSAIFETFVDGDQAMYDNVPPSLPAVDELDRSVIILHSSGSTGLPKPIYHTHGYLLNYAKGHKFEPEEDTSRVCTSTLPLFHGFGMLAPALALSIGKPFALPSASSVPNAESTIRLLQVSKSTSLMTVPLILEDLCYAADEAGIKALQPLDFVACGGGPMKTTVAEILSSRGVRLLNHCGATEIGALAPIFNPRPDYDWHYFVIRDDIGLRLENVLEKPGCVKLIGRAPGWDEDFIVQDFLQPNPKAPKSQFQFLGRADDLIVLANGEKIRCTSLEANIANDPRITDVIAFGEGHNHIGLIIEVGPDLKLDCSNREQIASFREEIWPTVENGNKDTDSHGTISKNMIIVTTSSHRPLPRTAKGSLARKEIFDLFAEEIDASYAEAELDVGPLPDIDHTPALENYIRSAVCKILGLLDEDTTYSVDDDLFEMGMNSLQATKLHNILRVAIDKKFKTQSDGSLLSKGFVYSHPTVATQCEALAALSLNRHGSSSVKEPSRTEIMNQAVDRHIKAIADISVASIKLKSEKNSEMDGKIVIVTGSTGNLGCTLVFNLAQDPSISHVYCLNRPSSSESSQIDRQYRAFNKAGICLPPHLWSKLHPLVAKPQEPNLGLSADIYTQLQGASHIIHNAWPMDFNRSLASFEAQFHYIDGIIKLALQSTSSTPPRVLFTSSIAAVARHPLRTHNSLVPEVPMDDPDVTAPFGYPEAKWVCEQILLKSAQLHPSFNLEPMIVRIGQLTGSRTAASWASTEHLPSVFRSSRYLGALPDIQGTLSWLPLDTAASSLLEILFQPSSIATSQVYHLENPTRQSWSEMLALLSRLLDTSSSPTSASNSASRSTSTTSTYTSNSPLPIISLPEWLSLVSADPDTEHNPAARLLEFLEGSFTQLGTGNLVLDTEKARQVSEVLAGTQGVDEGLVEAYVRFWRAEWGV